MPLSFIFFLEKRKVLENSPFVTLYVSVEVRDCLGTNVRTFGSRRGDGARDGGLASDAAQTTQFNVQSLEKSTFYTNTTVYANIKKNSFLVTHMSLFVEVRYGGVIKNREVRL